MRRACTAFVRAEGFFLRGEVTQPAEHGLHETVYLQRGIFVSNNKSAITDSASPNIDRYSATERPLSVKEAAAFLGLHPRTLDNWRSQKRGPRYRRIGRRKVVYLARDLREYLDSGIVEGDR